MRTHTLEDNTLSGRRVIIDPETGQRRYEYDTERLARQGIAVDSPLLTRQNFSYSEDVLAYVRGPGTDIPHRLFGVELELVPKNGKAEFQNELVERFSSHPVFICKHDSSIGDGGSEIVTAPMTLDEARDFFSRGLYKLQHARATQSCGMHIHTNLKWPSRPSGMQLHRMYEFIMHESMWPFIDEVARRKQNTYCNRRHDPLKIMKWVDYYLRAGERSNSHSHHDALYLSRRGTLEFRMFAASIDTKVMLANVEFVDSMMDFCRTDTALSAKDFQSYVTATPGKWPTLEKRLKLRRFEKSWAVQPLSGPAVADPVAYYAEIRAAADADATATLRQPRRSTSTSHGMLQRVISQANNYMYDAMITPGDVQGRTCAIARYFAENHGSDRDWLYLTLVEVYENVSHASRTFETDVMILATMFPSLSSRDKIVHAILYLCCMAGVNDPMIESGFRMLRNQAAEERRCVTALPRAEAIAEPSSEPMAPDTASPVAMTYPYEQMTTEFRAFSETVTRLQTPITITLSNQHSALYEMLRSPSSSLRNAASDRPPVLNDSNDAGVAQFDSEEDTDGEDGL